MFNKKEANSNRKGGALSSQSDSKLQEPQKPNMDIRSIMKDIQKLGNSYMTWKEKKQLENQKILDLGGKAPKKQRLTLSVARPMMKKQKMRDQKKQEQNLLLGRFEGNQSRSGAKRFTEKRKPEDMSLKCSEGIFRNGVLDVKHLLRPGSSRDSGVDKPMGFNMGFQDKPMGFKGKKGKGGKKNKGKKKGGGKKRH